MELRSHPRTPPSATLALVDALVHPQRGPIRSLRSVAAPPGDPAYVHVHAEAVPKRRLPGRPATMLCGGSALTWEQACCKAVGESVERSTIMDWDPTVRLASAAEIDPAIDVERFDAFHPTQRAEPGFPYARLRSDSPIGWIPAWSLTRSAPTFVPATLAHRFYEPRTPSDCFDECPVSGYACGNTLEEALLGALCEVAERDALTLCWLQRLAVSSLDLSSVLSDTMRDALSRFARSPVRLYCSELTTDAGIPAVLVAMVSSAPGWPAAAVATAADMSHERAVLKALGELSNGAALVRVHRQSGRPLPRTPQQIESPEDHGLFYAAASTLPHLDLILRPRRSVRAPEGAPASDDVLASLNEAVRRLAARGLEALAVELTAPEMAARGLHVVKVIVPGMLPIDFGRMPRHLGVPRLYRAPVHMGYADAATDPAGLNPAPHPFP
jgi:ribosomal protein S12 methylthiotransferase accessory factor